VPIGWEGFEMLKRVVVGVAAILVSVAILAPSKLQAAKKKPIISKVYCECKCYYIDPDEGIKISVKTFSAPGNDGNKCPNYNETKCRTDGNDGELDKCEGIVERVDGNAGVAPKAQPLAPVAPKSVAPKRVAPSNQPLAPVQ
jgi:hypothetical protein